MNQLTRATFLGAAFLALLTDLSGSEPCFCPNATVRYESATPIYGSAPLIVSPSIVESISMLDARPIRTFASDSVSTTISEPFSVGTPIQTIVLKPLSVASGVVLPNSTTTNVVLPENREDGENKEGIDSALPIRQVSDLVATETLSEKTLREKAVNEKTVSEKSPPGKTFVEEEKIEERDVANEPTAPPPFKPIRPIFELSASETVSEPTVVRKPAIPKSAPLPDPEEVVVTTPPPPMPLAVPKYDAVQPEIGNDETFADQRNETPTVPRSTLRGQSPAFKDALDEAMSTKPPLPQGLIGDPSAIPDKLVESPNTAGESLIPLDPVKQSNADPAAAELKTKQLTNGVLLLVTVITLGLLVYSITIAWDYRQRWMQTLTTQNNSFTPTFDDPALGGLSCYSHEVDPYDSPSFHRFGAGPMEF